MTNGQEPGAGRMRRLWREPTVHFFAIGLLLFGAHRILVGDPRMITFGPGLRADLARRFQDQNGRRPSPAELQASVESWERDEALYREALREHLDRDDPTVRSVLADKMRARALRELPKRVPTGAELAGWLDQHRAAYETPIHYDFEWVSFPRSEPAAASHRAAYAQALAAGELPVVLGRPVKSGDLTREQLAERLGAASAAAIVRAPPGAWQPLENRDAFLLARLNRIEGGLPSKDVLHARLVADWSYAREQEAVKRAVETIVRRYQFEEKR